MPQLVLIITGPLVDLLQKAGVLGSTESLDVYPCGAVQIDARGQSMILDELRELEAGNAGFRALAAFGERQYILFYPGWFAEKVDRATGNGVLIAPGVGLSVVPSEYDVGVVRVLISFYRSCRQRVAESLSEVIGRWFSEVGSKGAFGERGLKEMSRHLWYRDPHCMLTVDVTESGQGTLNTLLLAILNWGMSGPHPLESMACVPDAPTTSLWRTLGEECEETARNNVAIPLNW
ncbi:MAG TPA: hypothetical protein VG055_16555 [Planctomycetaceae bacterium]|nr:hypothetical protein [Planctomycetaceae bacterium]